MPRIALIHAVTVAMEPVHEAFRQLWPEAERVNLLDDALSPDLERSGTLNSSIRQRICTLADYAVSLHADGILYTCSAFGPAIEEASTQHSIPILKPNEAMFMAALDAGDNIGMLATFGPSVASMEDEFNMLAQRHGRKTARLRTVTVPAAMQALKRGDAAGHNTFLAEASRQFTDCDALMLAHFSTSRAEEAVKAVFGSNVLTAPSAAIHMLMASLQEIKN